MNTFDEILDAILKTIEDNPTQNIDDVIKEKMKEMRLSNEGEKLLEDTNTFLDAYDEALAKLQAAKDEGVSRKAWVEGELLKIADKKGPSGEKLSDEQKEQFVSFVTDACEKELNKTLIEEK